MIRTAESVSPMHPDKICDRISDAILDACLEQDPLSRVAIETMGGHGIITITGELTTNAYVDMRAIAQRITNDKYGVQINVVKQSNEIAQGVDRGGAGDQGIMVGYACDETPEKMPLEVMLARSLNRHIYESYPYDGKTQVTLDGNQITSIVASFQNVKSDTLYKIIETWLKLHNLDCTWDNVLCNPAGDWSVGGFEADTGLTGRKLMVDNYGPRVPIGGGCFSGKDPSKVDRSAAYMARWLAVQYQDRFNAKEVYVYLAYAIGRAMPLQATVIVDGKELPIESKYGELTPNQIIERLELRKPQYEKTAEYGHFGNGFTWDK